MFFQVDEKTVEEMMKKQRDKEASQKANQIGVEYKGHKLQFAGTIDGHVAILSEPSLISEIKKDDVEKQSLPVTEGKLSAFNGNAWIDVQIN